MEDEPINPNICCHVCGENDFEEREGFYYCLECGTKQEQVRLVEVVDADEFTENTGMKRKATKINVVKAEKPQLTSWEIYNYILRGYVEELISLGAKEELKLMALQVWAAYLRRTEVAFFNKKHADLPKLGIRYLKSDAETIYNHSKHVRRKRKRNRGDDATSGTSGEELSSMGWRKSKRKLDESLYSSMNSATSGSQLTSSTSANSNKAIKLNFNMKARKFFKKKMNAKHLLRHEMDGEGLLQCHNQPKVREIHHYDYVIMAMCLKQLYCILAIALNLIGDEMQLCDLVRFIQEGHIGWKNILQYFPENIASNGKELLKKIDFYKFPEKYSEKSIREHVSYLVRTLNIRKFKTPNMFALVRRYVTELCLPPVIGIYAERLINFLPPRFDTRSNHCYPPFEARAMAYIIFILKLLFGLDGQKEQCMSKAAKKLNRKIQQNNRMSEENRCLLFVWDEWVEYIEMRKVIVSHFNPTFCRQFKQCESAVQVMEQMSAEIRKQEEQEQVLNENVTNRACKQHLENFRSVFGTFLENNQSTKSAMPHIEFIPSFTPGLSYFKAILLQCDKANSSNAGNEAIFKIPDFMRVEHAERDMNPYVEVKPLIEYFQNHRRDLKVHSLATTKNRVYAGIFRPTRKIARQHRIHEACFNISEEEWAKNIKREVILGTDELEWRTAMEPYAEKYFAERLKKLQRQGANRDTNIVEEEHNGGITIRDFKEPGNQIITTITNGYKAKETSEPVCSIELFSENNMDPLPAAEYALTEPKRNLDRVNLFSDIDDEESLIIGSNETASILNDTVSSCGEPLANETIITSTGVRIKTENTVDSNGLKDRALKFYISNMDCWMLMGSMAMLSKSQRSQLQDKFPPIFKWLIETCAQTIGVDWSVVYEQLLCIEFMFCMGVEDLEKVENCVYLKYMNPIKDFQTLINTYREIW